MRADSKMTGKPLPGCVPPPDEIHRLQVLEPVPRPQVQHLRQVVGQVERGAAVDLVTLVPVRRRDHVLEANALLDVLDPDLGQARQHQRAEPLALARPIDVRVLVRHRHEHVKRAHARRGERGIGDAGVLHVKRRRLRKDVAVLDLAQVLGVILVQVDGVVGQVVVAPFDSQVEHERRAGESLAGDPPVRPPPSQVVGDQAGHGPGEVGVDDQGVGRDSTSRAVRTPTAFGPRNRSPWPPRRAGSPRPSRGRCGPWPPSPPRSRRSGDRRRARIPGTTGSRRGSGNGTATSPGISTETRTPAGCADR